MRKIGNDNKWEWLTFDQHSTSQISNSDNKLEEKTILPKGWEIIHDPSIPSVRTLERKYDAGINFTGNIDGFVIPPNLKYSGCSGTSLDFESSDHQPVTIIMKLR